MPPLRTHAVRDIIRVQTLRLERHDRHQRPADDFQLRVLTDPVGEGLRRADDLSARVKIALLADGDETRPAGGDEGTGTGARRAGGGVDAARPGRVDEVLVAAELLGAVEEGAVSLGGEAVFVRVAGDGGDALEAEVEGLGLEAGLFEEGDEEGAEAAVDVEGDGFTHGEAGERRDVVDDAVREVGGRADEEDGVRGDEAGDGADVDLVGGRGAGYEVDLNLVVFACFAEGCVSCFWENPGEESAKAV